MAKLAEAVLINDVGTQNGQRDGQDQHQHEDAKRDVSVGLFLYGNRTRPCVPEPKSTTNGFACSRHHWRFILNECCILLPLAAPGGLHKQISWTTVTQTLSNPNSLRVSCEHALPSIWGGMGGTWGARELEALAGASVRLRRNGLPRV